MIKVFIEVDDGADRFEVPIQAASISEAVRAAGERYPGGEVRVVFPIGPEEFFVRDSGVMSLIGLGVPAEATG